MTAPPQTSPTVSAIIPCYNGERFIGQAIESILAQTMVDFELIVVDDGSSDSSLSVVAEHMKDPRVRLIEHSQNKGIAAARNTGINASSGEFIAFLDQDDLWQPEKLARQLSVFRADTEGSIGLVFADHQIVSTHGPARRRLMTVPRDINALSKIDTLRALYMDNFVPMISVLVRRPCFDAVGMLDESIRSGADDYEFCTRIAQKFRIAYVNEKLVVRREHGHNYTDDVKLVPDALAINRALLDKYPELADLRAARESELLFKLGRAYQNQPDMDKAKQAYRDSLSINSGYTKARIALAFCHLGPLGNAVLHAWGRLRVRLG